MDIFVKKSIVIRLLVTYSLEEEWEVYPLPYLKTRDVSQSRSHVRSCILTFFDTQGVTLLLWPARSPDLSPTENNYSWVAERLNRHLSQDDGQVWQRLEVTLNEFISPMPNRTRAVLSATVGSCFY
ncbi:hypothetical protein TNCV_4360541 [Trichonephila clavipes]|uniref:Uncharacterized protein n=1 Tax=Trichonephila clavipes TaxID=2585209 RepID=A0A8X6WA13_TRICX|nr:hypothetical protein TNCV_4360541 [Trichonephila clavipes]